LVSKVTPFPFLILNAHLCLTHSRYTNSLVARQLQKQVHEENALQKSIIIMQQNSEHFEEGVVRAIQMAWSTFDEWK